MHLRKIHVVMQKESVDKEKLKDCTAVVLDVFLATSTILFLLKNNYEPIYAVSDSESALALKVTINGPLLLLGETKGKSIEGFNYPDPSKIKYSNIPSTAIICSTNGTKAIKKAQRANVLFISSLVNGHMVANKIHNLQDSSSILLICSGNDNRFSIEDFVGAGQIVNHLMSKDQYELSDSAKLAQKTYQYYLNTNFKDLLTSETAHLLYSLGFEKSVHYVLDHFEKVNIVPRLDGEKIIIDSSSPEKF